MTHNYRILLFSMYYYDRSGIETVKPLCAILANLSVHFLCYLFICLFIYLAIYLCIFIYLFLFMLLANTCLLTYLLNERDKVLRKSRKTKEATDIARYKYLRNRANNMLKHARNKYQRSLITENSLNPEIFWETIKEPSVSPMFIKDKNPANIFKEHYCNVVNKLKKSIFIMQDFVWKYPKKCVRRTYKTFKFEYMSKVFVEKQIKAFKSGKATGLDDLPSRLLKDSAACISKPISYIINMSLKTSMVPTVWKNAKITPIYKSGPTNNTENYRPISVLPVLSKVLEKATHAQLFKYLEDNNLISKFQFGYCAKRSTQVAATILLDNIRKEIDKGKFVGAVFIDLSKAFDTISHSILLNKLSTYGIQENELAWFTDYLFNRHQVVEVNRKLSPTFAINSGVPQGSILGPLLFVLFFNDVVSCLTKDSILKYADDTMIYFSSTDFHVIENTLQEDMDNLSNYFYDNELILNLKKGKTESMIFGTSKCLAKSQKKLKLSYQETIISNTSRYKYLGYILHQNLNMVEFFNNSYKKASSRLRLLTRVRPSLTTKSALRIYKIMIVPLLTYSSTIHLKMTETQLSKLKSIEVRGIRIITGGKESSKILIPNTMNIIKKNACMPVRKCLCQETCENLHDYFEVSNHRFNTKNNGCLLKIPNVKLEATKNHFTLWEPKFTTNCQLRSEQPQILTFLRNYFIHILNKTFLVPIIFKLITFILF